MRRGEGVIISPSSRPRHGRATVDSFSKIVTRFLENEHDINNVYEDEDD